MTRPNLPKLETLVLAVALIVLVLDAGGGPGWNAISSPSVLAARMDRIAYAPLYDVLASFAALMPWGEVGFRLGLLDAVLAAITLAGVVAAVRALVPRDVAASLISVGLLVIAPPFRDAAAFAGPSILAACGAVWAVALATRYARKPQRDARHAAAAIAACAVVVGSAPWLGAALTIAIITWLWRSGARELVAVSLGVLGLFVVVWWLDAAGSLPTAAGSLATAVATSGRGAAAILVGAGLVGVGFGALTSLPNARWLAALVVIAALHEIIVGGSAPALLAVLSIGVAMIPSAILRATQPELEGARRHGLAVGAGVPLVAIAAALGGTFTVEDPGATPTQLATDLAGSLPPGPGVFVATRPTTWFALQYEAVVAGLRPDLALVPPVAETEADAVVANALRHDQTVGADAPAFGRLDVRRAIPRGRGFQLVAEVSAAPTPVSGPAQYATEIGHRQAVLLALERARHEAASQRLDVAARALGLESRFGAADLAVLAATLTTNERPALFGFLPLDERPPGDWLIDVFGDDLAWVAGVPIPTLDDHAPIARRLHAKWREILLGKSTPDDPAIAALGPRAVAATKALFTEKK
ncbi:MAG TPA: hypothetical protein VIV40_17305 [Kofleriaceae bacterium]